MVFVRERGRAMAAASAVTPTGMSAVLGGDPDEVAAVAGAARADRGERQRRRARSSPPARSSSSPRSRTTRRPRPGSIPLQVAGAFHTAHMAPGGGRRWRATPARSPRRPARPPAVQPRRRRRARRPRGAAPAGAPGQQPGALGPVHADHARPRRHRPDRDPAGRHARRPGQARPARRRDPRPQDPGRPRAGPPDGPRARSARTGTDGRHRRPATSSPHPPRKTEPDDDTDDRTHRGILSTPTGAAHARIFGVGGYRPERVVPNSEIVDRIDSSDQWIRERSGIVSRRWAAPDESVVDMAEAAAREALDRRRARAVADRRRRPSPPSPTPTRRPAAAPHARRPARASTRRGVRHLRRVRRLLPRRRAGQRHGPRRQRRVRPGRRRREAVGLHRPHRPRRRRSSSATAPARSSIGPSDTPGIGPTVWGSDGAQWEAIRQRDPLGVDARRRQRRALAGASRWPGQAVFRWAVWQMAPVAQQALDAAGRQGRRPRRLHPAPGQHADHRRDDQAAASCPSTSRSPATSPRPATPPPRRSRWRWSGCCARARRRTAAWPC